MARVQALAFLTTELNRSELMIKDFLNAMHAHVPQGAKVMLCQFRGDPHDDSIPRKWVSSPLNSLAQLDPQANIYLTVSAMKRNERGEFRRRKDNFAGGLLLMIDDLGSGPGAKFGLELLDPLPPTAMIETSPSNFQAVYMFDALVSDMGEFNALIRAFIDRQFLGSDTGMAGVNRVFRPPIGINGKRKYGGKWRVKMTQWNPENRYSVAEIVKAFDLQLTREKPRIPTGATRSKAESIRHFVHVRSALRAAGMLKSEDANLEGWMDVVCPWTQHHTSGVDNGAAIRVPAPENDWCGAFRCHHGHCQGKGWSALTDWLASEQDDVLRSINANAKGWEEYNCDR